MIQVNLDKAKEITHEKRRDKRADLFKQLDIEATIQTEIDNAETVDQLKEIITQL